MSRLAVAFLGWSGTVLIARELGQEDFGAFTLVFSLLGMLSIVTDLGIGRVALAGLVDPDADSARFAGTYVILRAALGVVGYGVVVAFVVLVGYSDLVVRATLVAGVVVVLDTPAHAYEIVFQANHRLPLIAGARVAAQLGQLALTVALVVDGRSLVWLTVPAVLNAFLLLAITVPLAHRLEQFRYVIDRAIWWRLVREAVPLSVGTALATIYYRVDSIMLSKLDDLGSVGMYGVAYRFVDVAHFIPSALSVAILAVLVKAWPDDPATLRTTFRSAASVLALVGGLLVVEFLLFAEEIVTLLYGDLYGDAATAVRVLMIGEWASYFTSLSFAVLVATASHKRYPLITLAGLGLNVIANMVLIPILSFRGAAIATLITEVVVVVLMLAEVRRIEVLRPLPVRHLWSLAGPFGSALVVGLGVSTTLPWLAAAGASALSYVLVAHLMRFGGPEGLVGLVRIR